MKLAFRSVVDACREVGIVTVACLSKEQLESILRVEKERLIAWQNAGYAGEMQYMQRSPELFCNPENLLTNFKSAVVCYVPYPTLSYQPTPYGHGRIARYAMFADYHVVIKDALHQAIDTVLRTVHPLKFKYRIFSDAVPFLEKSTAYHSGLGFIGKNLLLSVPGIGSFGFIAEILLDVELDIDSNTKLDVTVSQHKVENTCGACSRCLKSCPTHALIDDGRQLNATMCISYLTIEKKTLLTEKEMRMIGDNLFGCDRCQDVCPNNKAALSVAGTILHDKQILPQFLALKDILALNNDDDFDRVFHGTSLTRAGRDRLVRNACCVVANNPHAEFTPILTQLAQHDQSELVRSQATMALEVIQM